MVERLNKCIKLVRETRLGALEHKVERGFVARLAEGAVAAVGFGDVVEVPEDVLESAETGRKIG